MLKMVALAPIPNANDIAATMVKAGFFHSIRKPYSMSCHSVITALLRWRLNLQTDIDVESSGQQPI